ncbi:unnamed protein product [Fusarium graminearum]|nr:unnamed protein product [Fusarium graminearum]
MPLCSHASGCQKSWPLEA